MRIGVTKKQAATGVGALMAVALAAFPASARAHSDGPGSGAGSSGNPALQPTGADAPNVGGNLANQHYSRLTQIDHHSLQKLGPAWQTHISAAAPASDDVGQETTPIVADGVIYVDTPSGGVIAVDGKTGATRWKWEPTEFAAAGTRRGVSIGEGKVYTTASGGRVVALDKDTGQQVWVVQPKAPDGESLGDLGPPATVYYGGLVYAHAANGNRAAVVALSATDGSYRWHFFAGQDRGTVLTDVNGNSVEPAETWGPILPDGTDCGLVGGEAPWMHGAVDPELGMYYMTFGNARSCNSSQDGSNRPGDDLFADTMVAVDLKSGEYKWHYQSIRHDTWDMDNVHPPTLADVKIDGKIRHVVFYGSKSGHQFILDRTNGRPVTPVVEEPMIVDSRQHNAPTQKFPTERLLPQCVVWQKLDPHNIPGNPWRAVPNYNGYQPDADGNLVFNPDSYVKADQPYLTYPNGEDHRKGCMYDPQWNLPILSTTAPNGGADWANDSYSHRTNLVYYSYGTSPTAHWNGAATNGQRAIGQYQTGGILAYDASTGKVNWRNHIGLDMAHGQGSLSTASNLLFVGEIDGRLLALDTTNGKVLWQFQTGTGVASAPITYEIDGQQYVAVLAAGTTNPYGGSVTQGDSLWAFKLGGSYTTDSGSQEGPLTAPLSIRRPVSGGPVEGSTVNNTVYLARSSRTADTAAARDSVLQAGMQPTDLRVPVGTTVTFLNPGAETFPNFPNQLAHCATQFFEGEFNAKLNPGESFKYTFDKAGEYFFNDCTDPRPTGKIEVYLTPEDQPGALSFAPRRLDLGSPTGIFTGVHGMVTAFLDLPAGYRYDGDAVLKTPLGKSPVPVARATQAGHRLIVKIRKADLDNNVPEGDAVPLTLVANFQHNGGQEQLTSTVSVEVTK